MESVKDIAGNPLSVGDRVATDVLSCKRSRLVVGEVTFIGKRWMTVAPVEGLGLGRTIERLPSQVAKVAGGV